jgi:mRNA interferase RelE/StbE
VAVGTASNFHFAVWAVRVHATPRLPPETAKAKRHPVRYTVNLTDEVKAALHAMPLPLRREIGHKLFLLEEDLSGNVKKLKGSRNEYRLRIGDYRVLFELEGRRVTVYAAGNRKDIYK